MKEQSSFHEEVRDEVEKVADETDFSNGYKLCPALLRDIEASPPLANQVEEQEAAVDKQAERCGIPYHQIANQVNLRLQYKQNLHITILICKIGWALFIIFSHQYSTVRRPVSVGSKPIVGK